jgi:hypothetical protein
MSSERGITVVELLVGMTAGIAVLLGLFTVSQSTLRGSARVQQRVDATQRARPVMAKILDELHSSCVSPGVPPVLAGSTDSSIAFLHDTGADVTPLPDKRVISLTGTTLSETIYPYSSGGSPDYVFGTPTTTRLLTNVSEGTVDGALVDVFRYYAYDVATGMVNPTPLPIPLSDDDAGRTVQVDIAFQVAPSKTQVIEANPTAQKTEVTLDNSVMFRFSPAAEDASQSQVPCT